MEHQDSLAVVLKWTHCQNCAQWTGSSRAKYCATCRYSMQLKKQKERYWSHEGARQSIRDKNRRHRKKKYYEDLEKSRTNERVYRRAYRRKHSQKIEHAKAARLAARTKTRRCAHPLCEAEFTSAVSFRKFCNTLACNARRRHEKYLVDVADPDCHQKMKDASKSYRERNREKTNASKRQCVLKRPEHYRQKSVENRRRRSAARDAIQLSSVARYLAGENIPVVTLDANLTPKPPVLLHCGCRVCHNFFPAGFRRVFCSKECRRVESRLKYADNYDPAEAATKYRETVSDPEKLERRRAAWRRARDRKRIVRQSDPAKMEHWRNIRREQARRRRSRPVDFSFLKLRK